MRDPDLSCRLATSCPKVNGVFLFKVKRWLPAAVVLAAVGCRSDEADTPESQVVPVTVVALEQRNPAGEQWVTGAAHPWKEEDIGFEVGGRVVEVVEPGISVLGPESLPGQEQGATLLARLDDRRYRQRVAANQARQQALQLERKASQSEVEDVLSAAVAAAAAERTRAQQSVQRVRSIRADNPAAASQRELDEAEAALGVAQAKLNQAIANRDVKEAGLAALDAQIKELEIAVEQAQMDVDDCQLFAPFPGQVASVHVLPGGLVEAGQPVATLVMMDPLKVDVTVSAQTDRRIQFGDHVRLRLPDLEIERWGTVFQKDTKADPTTGTFTVTVIVRNEKIEIPDRPDLPYPRIHEFRILRPLSAGQKSPLYIERESLYRDKKGYFAWRIVDWKRGDFTQTDDFVRRLERVDLKVGEGEVKLPGQFAFVELVDAGGLTSEDVLACGVPEGFRSDQEVLLVRQRWLFRPGDLAEIQLPRGTSAPGYYLPMQSILAEGDTHFVFFAEDADEASPPEARRVEVSLHDRLGNLWRVEPVASSAEEANASQSFRAGARIVLAGAQFLRDGDPLRVIKTEEVAP